MSSKHLAFYTVTHFVRVSETEEEARERKREASSMVISTSYSTTTQTERPSKLPKYKLEITSPVIKLIAIHCSIHLIQVCPLTIKLLKLMNKPSFRSYKLKKQTTSEIIKQMLRDRQPWPFNDISKSIEESNLLLLANSVLLFTS